MKSRVKLGGHNVNPDIVRERYLRGMALLKHYKDFPDALVLLDNTRGLRYSALLEKGRIVIGRMSTGWVQSILADTPKKESIEGKSIEEILRLYKGKKDQ